MSSNQNPAPKLTLMRLTCAFIGACIGSLAILLMLPEFPVTEDVTVFLLQAVPALPGLIGGAIAGFIFGAAIE
jgi:hypothetical protein